jgi:hypothetical protein
MKTALCISGHMRTYKKTFESLKRNVIDILNPDVFIATWDELGFWGGYDHQIGFNNKENKININDIQNTFQPKKIKVDKYEDFDEMFLNRSKNFESNKIWYNEIWYTRPKNAISMYHKSNESVLLKQNFEIENDFKYDLVIKTRPDILYHEKIPSIISEYDGSLFYILNKYTHHTGYGDIFFAGNSNTVDSFFNLYNDFEILFSKNLKFCPHEYVKHYLEYKSIDFRLFEMNVELINSVGGYCQSL